MRSRSTLSPSLSWCTRCISFRGQSSERPLTLSRARRARRLTSTTPWRSRAESLDQTPIQRSAGHADEVRGNALIVVGAPHCLVFQRPLGLFVGWKLLQLLKSASNRSIDRRFGGRLGGRRVLRDFVLEAAQSKDAALVPGHRIPAH